MEKLIEILQGIRSGVDYEKEKALMTDKILDSIDIANLVAELEDVFGVEIGMEYMDNSNFESAEAIWQMIQEVK